MNEGQKKWGGDGGEDVNAYKEEEDREREGKQVDEKDGVFCNEGTCVTLVLIAK